MRLSKTKSVNEPEELVISVVILGSSQGMGDTFDAVDDRAGEVVSWIYSENIQ